MPRAVFIESSSESRRVFKVGANQGDRFINGVVDALVVWIGFNVGDGAVGVAETLQQMAFQHVGHQTVDGATHGGQLLQHGAALNAFGHGTFQSLCLAFDAAQARDGAFFVFNRMGHDRIRFVG